MSTIGYERARFLRQHQNCRWCSRSFRRQSRRTLAALFKGRYYTRVGRSIEWQQVSDLYDSWPSVSFFFTVGSIMGVLLGGITRREGYLNAWEA